MVTGEQPRTSLRTNARGTAGLPRQRRSQASAPDRGNGWQQLRRPSGPAEPGQAPRRARNRRAPWQTPAPRPARAVAQVLQKPRHRGRCRDAIPADHRQGSRAARSAAHRPGQDRQSTAALQRHGATACMAMMDAWQTWCRCVLARTARLTNYPKIGSFQSHTNRFSAVPDLRQPARFSRRLCRALKSHRHLSERAGGAGCSNRAQTGPGRAGIA